MFKSIAKLFGTGRKTTTTTATTTAKRTRLGLEGLEAREVPAALTLQQFANNLVNVSRADAARVVRDIAVIESQRPTVLANAIVQDAVRINNDIQSGTLVKMFSDFAPLVQHLNQELALQSYYGLPASAALANYTVIQSDLKAIGTDYAVTVMFLRDLNAQTQTVTMPAAAPVSGFTQVYSDLAAMGRWGGMTPSQNPGLNNLIQSIPSSAWSRDPSVIAVNQMVNRMLGG